MASQEEQVRAAIEAAFKEVDTDNSGSINKSELKNAMVKAGFKPRDEDIELMLREADQNQSGSLNFEEFAALMIAVAAVIKLAMELRLAFEALDTDGNGYITKDELKRLIQESGHGHHVSDEDVEKAIQACDADGDGRISFEEFVKNVVG